MSKEVDKKPKSLKVSIGTNNFSIKPTNETEPYSLDIIMEWRHRDYNGTNYEYKDALKIAKHIAESGEAVLLSPACASFDLFENYEDRGRQFKNAVRNL